MCTPQYSYNPDAADDLRILLELYLSEKPSNAQIRKLVRERWDELKRLGHILHNEEVTTKLAERKARAERDGYSLY